MAQFEQGRSVPAEYLTHPAFHNKDKGCDLKRWTLNKSDCRLLMDSEITYQRDGKDVTRKIHLKCDRCDFVGRLKCNTHSLNVLCPCGFEFGWHCGIWSEVYREDVHTPQLD